MASYSIWGKKPKQIDSTSSDELKTN